tara:strand:- start:236 stop:751 length:516 start_codon:yes stop_codon:yes gene_type:complete
MSNYLSSDIKDYIDFPKKGIIFKDVLPVLQKPDVFLELINKMSSSEIILKSDAIVAIDARGFIFGSAISLKIKKPLVLARKPGKLPGELITKSYSLEYGENSLSIQKSSIKNFKSFSIVDDLLATGGTAKSVSEILMSQEKEVLGLSIVVELGELNAREKLDFPVISQIVV